MRDAFGELGLEERPFFHLTLFMLPLTVKHILKARGPPVVSPNASLKHSSKSSVFLTHGQHHGLITGRV